MNLLPPIPLGCRTLTNEEAEHLVRLHPALPTPDKCVTCEGSHSFRWWDYYVEEKAPAVSTFDDYLMGVETGQDKQAEIITYDCPGPVEPESTEQGCLAQWVMNRWFLHCGIGLNYQRLGWNDYVGSPLALQTVQEWRQSMEWNIRNGVGLVLRGGIGTGKTILAALLLKDIVGNHSYDGMMVGFTEMISAMTAGWRSAEDRLWFVKRVKNADVLLLDDIGREFKTNRGAKAAGEKEVPTGLAETALDEVLRHRLSNAKPTIITTNLDWGDLATYGPNVMSLLQERSVDLAFEGEDYRAAQRAKAKVDFERQANLRRPVVVG